MFYRNGGTETNGVSIYFICKTEAYKPERGVGTYRGNLKCSITGPKTELYIVISRKRREDITEELLSLLHKTNQQKTKPKNKKHKKCCISCYKTCVVYELFTENLLLTKVKVYLRSEQDT